MPQSSKQVFVLMPFRDEFLDVYMVIRQAVAAAGNALGMEISCLREDDIARPGRITDHIVESIRDADLLIADITGPNANVMYELGYAHALSKAVLILNQKVEESPFDVAGFRQVSYDRSRLNSECLPRVQDAVAEVFGDQLAALDDLHVSDASDTSSAGLDRVSRRSLIPSPHTFNELQRLHVQMQFANSLHSTSKAEELGREVSEVLSRINVMSAGDDDDIRITAGVAGNCAVELEKAHLPSLAEEIYRKAIGLFPDHAGLHVQYADFLVDAKRFDEAERELNRTEELAPDERRLLRTRTKLTLKSGLQDDKVAAELWTAFLEDPTDFDTAVSYSLYLTSSHAPLADFEGFCAVWLEKDPARRETIDRVLADRLASSDETQHEARAIEIYENLLERGNEMEDRHDILHNLATLLARTGEKARAKDLWTEAYEMDRNDPSVQAAFSQRLVGWGEMEAAIAVSQGEPLP